MAHNTDFGAQTTKSDANLGDDYFVAPAKLKFFPQQNYTVRIVFCNMFHVCIKPWCHKSDDKTCLNSVQRK